jgi:hypothetical protein
MRIRSFLGLGLVAALAACGGGGGGGDDTQLVDSGVTIDGPVQHTCATVADYGTPTLGNQQAAGSGTDHTMPDGEQLQASLNADATPDIIDLELIKGFGVFTANIVTGDFTLSGAELNYETCGLCPRLFTDIDAGTGMSTTEQYYASAGEINITSINPNLTGTFTGLQFEEVTIDATTFHSTPVPDGCTTSIASGSFDIAVTFQ